MTRSIPIAMSFCFAIVLFTSCVTAFTAPLTGKYTENQFEITSNNAKDSIWEKVIAFCTQEGLSIRVMDKSTGFISIDKLDVPWTFENMKLKFKDDNWVVTNNYPDSMLQKPNAWLVLQKHYKGGSVNNVERPASPLSAEWTIYLKALADGKTSITISRIYVKESTTYFTKYRKYVNENTWTAFSTGVMEKALEQKINN